MKSACNPRIWVGRRPTKATIDSVKLWFFYGTKFDEHENFPLNSLKQLLEHPNFDVKKPTCFYFHGYVEKMTDEHIELIADAYQSRNDHNLIMVDWNDMAEGSYLLDALPNAVKLGKTLGEMLVDLTNDGFPLESVHLVGHSLGGQLVGYIGRTVIEKSDSKMKIKRISALDPAFPGFYPAVFGTHISCKDAEFVDIIHTDAWLYGTPATTGTADFWPNAGKTLQPGCPKRNYKMLSDIDLCSHRRSWRFWAESVKSKDHTTFQAVKADSWKQFKEGSYDSRAPVVSMGLNCPTDARGNYYLQTNGELPFSKGIAGTHYVKLDKQPKDQKKSKNQS